MTAEERFWAKVDRGSAGDCWEWTGGTNTYGYGRIGVNGRSEGAHRLSYRMAHGPIPDGLHVLHHCDNPPCVNPAHLYAGTPQQNTDDQVRRGRLAIGETNGQAKLTAEDVREIRRQRAEGRRLHRIAAQFGISEGNVSRIAARRTWRSVA